MNEQFESILDECISALQAGIPLEEILAEVPDYATELRPLLYAAMVLADPNPVLVPTELKTALRSEYLKQVSTLPDTKRPTLNEKAQAIYHIIRRRLTYKIVLNDLITITVTAILTLTMATLILMVVAKDSIPGDLLYSLKRLSENVQLLLPLNESRQKELQQTFNEQRLTEIEQLMQQNRVAVVEFSGVLERKGEKLWIIEGYAVLLPENVTIEGQPQEGNLVHVMGLLRANHTLVADTISTK